MHASAAAMGRMARPGIRTRVREPGRLTRTEMLIAACALAVMVCAALAPAVTSSVPSSAPTVSIRVASDDTLWGIAKAHPVPGSTTAETVSLIRELNDREGSMIAVGEVLRVPAPAAALTALARR
jgi:nucleoid-associated protein YgaU